MEDKYEEELYNNNIAIKSVKADYNLLFTKITGVK